MGKHATIWRVVCIKTQPRMLKLASSGGVGVVLRIQRLGAFLAPKGYPTLQWLRVAKLTQLQGGNYETTAGHSNRRSAANRLSAIWAWPAENRAPHNDLMVSSLLLLKAHFGLFSICGQRMTNPYVDMCGRLVQIEAVGVCRTSFVIAVIARLLLDSWKKPCTDPRCPSCAVSTSRCVTSSEGRCLTVMGHERFSLSRVLNLRVYI